MTLHKIWDNREQLRKGGRYNGWDRRVRWYQGAITDSVYVRLRFEDKDGSVTREYATKEGAQTAWDDFKKGNLTVRKLLGG